MGYGARRWLIGLGVVAVAGGSVLGQAGVAGAATAGAATAGAAAARSVAAARSAPAAGGFLRLGSHGPAVKALQRRLTALHYYLGKIDGKFGWYTMEAVWAFKEVQFGERRPPKPNIVGSLMQRQLKHPKWPRAHRPHGGGWRVEVNKNLEVLVVYKHGKITLISHVSTAAYNRPDGSGWVTPNGRYRAQEYVAGPVRDSELGDPRHAAPDVHLRLGRGAAEPGVARLRAGADGRLGGVPQLRADRLRPRHPDLHFWP